MKHEWFDVSKEKPSIGRDCIAVVMDVPQWMAVIWNGEYFEWADGYEYGDSALDPLESSLVTHWMYYPTFNLEDVV